MKIAYCLPDYSLSGGTERTLSLKTGYLADVAGHEVHVIASDGVKNKTPFYKFSEKTTFHNLAVDYTECDSKPLPMNFISKIKKGRLHRERLQRLLSEIKPDITVCVFSYELPFLWKLPQAGKTVVEFHFSRHYQEVEMKYNHIGWLKKKAKLLTEWWRRRFISRYDAFVILTEEDAACWKHLHNVHIIPNALTFVPETAAQLDSKVVMSVGRLTTQKGFDLLLEAWREAHAALPGWKLVIYGEGEDRQTLQRYVDENSLSDSVSLPGNEKNIVSRYLQASVFVLSSRYEGFGMVLTEAMACGVPCVSFACPCGPKDIVRDGEDGMLVPDGDVKALASAIVRMASDDALRLKMGTAARQNVDRFSLENVMDKWNTLFESLLKEK